MLSTYDRSIEEISQSIFATMIGAELVRADEQDLRHNESLQAMIHIAGGWTGCVVITLSEGVSRSAAANLLGVKHSELSMEDLEDTATELANMVGGNLKSVLPGPSYLSLPSIVRSEESGLRSSGADIIDDVWFTCEFGPFRVRVFQKRME